MTQSLAQPGAIALQEHDTRQNIYDFSPESLVALFMEWGEPAYRATQVLHWLYKELASDFTQMSNLPLSLRRKLAENLRIGSAQMAAQKISSDGWTRKALLKLRDGNTIETVLMLYYDRATICVSSQVGCAMGCTFCATGQMGFTRNLSSGEIVEQVIWFDRWLREHPHRPAVTHDNRPRRHKPRLAPGRVGHRPPPQARRVDPDSWFSADHRGTVAENPSEIKAVTNIVFMGMGEPLVNYHNLWAAIHTLNSPQGLGIGARRMTVSTVGIAPQIRHFAHEGIPVNLAVSLHAPTDELRSSMMPMNDRYPIAELIAACRDYAGLTHRRVTFEYVLINSTNDSLECARQLSQLLSGLLCHVNLIPLNPVPGMGMKATPHEQIFAFQKVLEDSGIPTTVRIERGVDIAAACGQLKVQEEPGSRRRSLNPDLVRAHVEADLASV